MGLEDVLESGPDAATAEPFFALADAMYHCAMNFLRQGKTSMQLHAGPIGHASVAIRFARLYGS